MPEKKSSTHSKQSETVKNALDGKEMSLLINRELSLLEFQKRVLEEALDENNKLLERLKFLAIVGSNLDEFFMVRVSGIKKQIESGIPRLSVDGLTPAEQLVAIRKTCQEIMVQARTCLHQKLLPDLRKAGIVVLNYDELNDRQRKGVRSYFEEVIYPVVTPLALDPGHPFPHISNLSLNLAVIIRDKHKKEQFARIKVPDTLPRFVPLKRSSGGSRRNGTAPYYHYFVWLEQVIAANLLDFFPGMEVIEAYPFRVTRDADMAIQELEASDLLETIEETMRQRRFGSVVRMTIYPGMPARIKDILVENLDINPNDIYELEQPLGLSGLMPLAQIDRFDLRDQPFIPATPPCLVDTSTDSDIFTKINEGDILLHHPYDSFNPVVDFLRISANDPDVLAIKQTLYRVGKNPPVVQALLEAVENGKQVAVLVELKARFDEESNIGWAKMLERAGVHVVYGLLGLKTHSKVALVIRREGEGIRRYLHLATGNYNAVTANLYEDIGMFTCDEEIGADATDLFNFLTGYSAKEDYRKLLVAPINLRERMEKLIRREIQHQKEGDSGYMIIKINSLVDKQMIKLLYEASQAGVKIDLLVRGMCCLRPGLQGVSENIRVISIVGRFLEHSRVYYFRNGGNEEVLLGSADLMPRNIDWRVEVLFPVQDPHMIQHIYKNILCTYLNDNMNARIMQPDGSYKRAVPIPDSIPVDSQQWFLDHR
jgi:polyphosphate kinase